MSKEKIRLRNSFKNKLSLINITDEINFTELTKEEKELIYKIEKLKQKLIISLTME